MSPPGYCAEDDEIENYLKHLKVQLFVIEDALDLREFDGKSIQKSQTLVADNPLFVRSEIPGQYVTLGETIFESYEGQIGDF